MLIIKSTDIEIEKNLRIARKTSNDSPSFMSNELHQMMYISTANAELTEDALLELLSSSQKRNAAKEITGLLLHSDGNIIQVMEGPKDSVQGLYKKIAADKRHRGVTLMSSRAIAQRDFPHYKMGFKRARSRDFKEQLPGFTDIVEKSNSRDFPNWSQLLSPLSPRRRKSTASEIRPDRSVQSPSARRKGRRPPRHR